MLNHPGEAYVRQSVVSRGPVALERVILGTFWSFLSFFGSSTGPSGEHGGELGPGINHPLG